MGRTTTTSSGRPWLWPEPERKPDPGKGLADSCECEYMRPVLGKSLKEKEADEADAEGDSAPSRRRCLGRDEDDEPLALVRG